MSFSTCGGLIHGGGLIFGGGLYSEVYGTPRIGITIHEIIIIHEIVIGARQTVSL